MILNSMFHSHAHYCSCITIPLVISEFKCEKIQFLNVQLCILTLPETHLKDDVICITFHRLTSCTSTPPPPQQLNKNKKKGKEASYYKTIFIPFAYNKFGRNGAI